MVNAYAQSFGDRFWTESFCVQLPGRSGRRDCNELVGGEIICGRELKQLPQTKLQRQLSRPLPTRPKRSLALRQ